jgi:hypothetical protein
VRKWISLREIHLAHKIHGSDFVSNKEKGQSHTENYPDFPASLREYTEVNKT